MAATPLPIDSHLPEIARALEENGALVLTAPPGTGKTTRVPGALVDRGMLGEVVVLEPRRLAARAAARRVAAERGGAVGGEVGYTVRHDSAVSDQTRIRFVTEGVLVRRLVADPFLDGVGAVVLDEFHERHLEGDLALAMLREVRETVRPELRIAVMSATLSAAEPAAFLDCPMIDVPTPLHPVQVVHETQVERGPVDRRVAAAARRALEETAGDVLVFLPGVGEIAAAGSALAGLGEEVEVVALHGRLSAAEQDRAIVGGERRRVVLSTNIAESSLTIEGVTAVVDSGLARVLRHDAGRGLDVLRVERISQASAEQRRGRAGRLAPGICYRLWTAGEERGMVARDAPEVQRVDVAGAVLQVRGFGGRPPQQFGWFEAPPSAALERADQLLGSLGALRSGGAGLTEVGQQMLDLPLHPRLARVMLAADRAGCSQQVGTLAALLSERDVFRRDATAPPADILEVAALVGDLERRRVESSACRAAGVDAAAVRGVLRLRDRMVRRRAGRAAASDDDVIKCLLAGFPDRVARRAAVDATEAVMVGGRGLSLSEEAAAGAGELFLALQTVQTGRRERARARVVRLAPLRRAWLDEVFPDRVAVATETALDPNRPRVVAVRRVSFDDLVLEEARGGDPDPDIACELLVGLLRQDPWPCIQGSAELRRFVERAGWLHRTAPELLPSAIDDAAVADAAGQLCAGRRSLDGLKGVHVLEVLRGLLPADARAAVDRRAPARLQLPSGRRVPVDYAAPAGPTVAAPLQEFFGLANTPTLGAGGVAVVLELLAPNRRPVQVTRDLASFWANVYPRVRSELRRRYPRHAWPENPLTAEATASPKRRRSS